MKIAKRVLATVMAMLMIVGTVTLAASAAVQDQVSAGGTVPVDKDIWESLVISNDVTIDLQGHTLNGLLGSSAIVVKDGANVTVQNGYIKSRYEKYTDSDEDVLNMIDNVLENSPAAIIVEEDSSITLENVRVVGSFTRVPYTQEALPTGNALVLKKNATATLRGASLFGMNGVYNWNGGSVVVEDAIVLGYDEAISGPYTLDGASEQVVAADLAETDFLAKGVTLTEDEKDILRAILGNKAVLATKKATADQAILTIDKKEGYAYVTAQPIYHTNAYSDCSYTLVPSKGVIWNQGGTTKEFFTLGAPISIDKVEGKDVRVQYRVQYNLQDDVYQRVNGGYNDIAYTYNLVVNAADRRFPGMMAEYDKLIAKFADLYGQIDGLLTREFMGVNIVPNLLSEAQYYDLVRDLIAIGGVTMYNAAMDKASAEDPEGTYYHFHTGKFRNGEDEDPLYYGVEIPEYEAEGRWVTKLGALDTIDSLVDALVDAKGNSFAYDGSNWGNMAAVLLDNYQAVIDMIPQVIAGIEALEEDINVIASMEHGEDILAEFGEDSPLAAIATYKQYCNDALYAYNTVINSAYFTQAKTYIDENKDEIAAYFNKAGDVVTNPQTYIDLDEYLAGDKLNSFFVYGPTTLKTIEPADLHVIVSGNTGTITFSEESIQPVTNNEEYTDIPFSGSITLTATADEGNEFLYWKNGETKRIMSTNTSMTIATGLERYVEAVFATKNEALAILTTNSGSITWMGNVTADGVNLANAEEPFTPGYTNSTWGPEGIAVGGTYPADKLDASAYKTGSSAFDDLGVIYDGAGYAFKVNSTTNNKYIVTPKDGTPEKHAMYFIENGKKGNAAVDFGKYLSYTSKTGNYWVDAAGNAISVYQKYKMISVTDRSVYPASGAAPKACVSVVRADQNPCVFYVERSVAESESILSTGIIYGISYDGEPAYTAADLKAEKVDGESILKNVTTSTARTGLYAVRVNEDLYYAGCTITAVGFIELSNGEMVYSKVPVSVEAVG